MMMMMTKKMRMSKDNKETLISKTLRVSLQKKQFRKCKSRKKRIKQTNSKKMTTEEVSDLETDEERNNQKEALIDLTSTRKSSPTSLPHLEAEYLSEPTTRKTLNSSEMQSKLFANPQTP